MYMHIYKSVYLVHLVLPAFQSQRPRRCSAQSDSISSDCSLTTRLSSVSVGRRESSRFT